MKQHKGKDLSRPHFGECVDSLTLIGEGQSVTSCIQGHFYALGKVEVDSL